MKYNTFEDLPVWNNSRKFVNEIYNLINKNNKLKRDYSLNDQLKRSSCSIMLNIAEGFERSTNKEFSNFLNIAKGSAGEVRCILYILFDNKYINENQFNSFVNVVKELSMQIASFRKYLLNNLK